MKELRRSLREKRLALSPSERERHSIAIARNLLSYLPFRRARKVALYIAMAEEVDTGPVIELASGLNKELYLPVVNISRLRQPPLLFHRFISGATPMKINMYGIPEPVHTFGTCIRGPELDLACVPLVGFNDRCDRIGMGAGYYDRTFANRGFRKTRLVGLAFGCQQAEFEPAAHDVPMDSIVTEKGVLTR